MKLKLSFIGIIKFMLPLLILAAWYIAELKGWFTPAILPPIRRVVTSFIKLVQTGQLQEDIIVSITRVLKGYSIAVIAGITLGTLMGTSKFFFEFFSLTLNGIRQIPMLAWIPLIILWFGIGEESKVAIIVLGAYFPILLNTISGIKNTDQRFVEVARLYRLSPWQTFTKVYLPSALPSILVGLKLGLGISWVAVVAAELIAASSGIGFRISDARSLMMPDVVIVGMLVIGTIGLLMDKILTYIFNYLTPWVRK